MLRRIIAFLILIPALLTAAIWPDSIGNLPKTSTRPVAVSDRPVWDEYGFQEAETAEYKAGDEHFAATAWRFRDPTGAFAAFQWQCPAGAQPSTLGEISAQTDSTVWLVFGNYLFRLEGRKPSVEELAPLLSTLPLLDQSSLPPLTGYLPEENLIPNSRRFILGPVSLASFKPLIPPATAAFHYGAEAQIARYRSTAGEIELCLLSYPTPQIARERLTEFQKLPEAMVKRSGPLLAVILSPSDPNEAERILSKVRYQATIAWSEYVPTQRDNIGDLVITAFVMTGLLLLFAFISGLAFGGLRLLTKFVRGKERTDDAMIQLNLEDR